MTRRSSILLCLTVLACDPTPKIVGEGVLAGDQADGDFEIAWRYVSALDEIVGVVASTPAHGVIFWESDPYGPIVRRLSAEGEEELEIRIEGLVDDIDATDDGFYVTGSTDTSEANTGHRGTIWRFSSTGDVVAQYVHPRIGEDNAFGFALAVGADEVAVVVGNWGQLVPGESWFEVQRLTLDLEPVGEPVLFENEVADVGYGPGGELFALEAIDDAPARLHAIGGDDPALEVDCATLLLAGGEAPACGRGDAGFHLTWLDSGEAIDAGLLGFASYIDVSRGSAIVLSGTDEEAQHMRIVTVADDGTPTATGELPLRDDALHQIPHDSAQAPDDSIYVSAVSILPDGTCPNVADSCLRGEILRLEPR